MANPISGHTTHLTDGDFIQSPSFTNIYEGLHGNGILALEDTHSESLHRNTPASLPGAISHDGNYTITVKGGYAVLDGLLVSFANGYGSSAPNTFSIELTQTNVQGTATALASGETALFVVYICSHNDNAVKNIKIQKSSNTSQLPANPTGFLTDPSGLDGSLDLDVKQSTVLAVVRATYQSSNGGNLNVDIQEVIDMRTFIRPTPMYLPPLLDGAIGETPHATNNRVSTHTALDGMHGASEENGAFLGSPYGAIWMGFDQDGNNVLYFSGKQDNARRTFKLGPDRLRSVAGNSPLSFKFDGAKHFYLTPTGAHNLNPSGVFPPGHTVMVSNASSGSDDVTFDSTGLNNAVKPQTCSVYVYDATGNWKRIMSSGFASSSSSGGATAIQLGAGDGTFSNDTDLTFTGGNTLNTPNLVLSGLASGATGLQFVDAGSNPGTAKTIWHKTTENRFYHNTTKFLLDGDLTSASFTFIGLQQTPSNYSGAANKFLQVNSTPDAIIFDNIAEGDLPTVLPSVTSIGSGGSTLTAEGNVTIDGTLTVSGGTTTISSTTITVDDKNIELGAVDTPTDSTANLGGITLKGASDKKIEWLNSIDAWTFNQHVAPAVDSASNLGTTSLRWATGYMDVLNSTSIVAGATGITSTGDVAIDTDTLFVDVSEDAVGISTTTPKASLQIKDGVGFDFATASRSGAGTSAMNIDLFNTQEFGGGKLLVEIRQTTDNIFETSEIVVNHDGRTGQNATAHNHTVYATVRSDGSATSLVTFTTALNSGTLQLVATPVASGKAMTAKVGWQAFEI